MKNKKGQLKIQEMAFVLVAIIILFVLVILFFVAFMSRVTSQLSAQTRDARAITLLEVISSLPELRCSSSFSSVSESVCLDYDKVNFFSDLNSAQLRNRYGILWENSYVSKIEIQQIYPTEKNYVIYSKESNENTKSYATYAALCKDDGQINCSIAKVRATIIMPKGS